MCTKSRWSTWGTKTKTSKWLKTCLKECIKHVPYTCEASLLCVVSCAPPACTAPWRASPRASNPSSDTRTTSYWRGCGRYWGAAEENRDRVRASLWWRRGGEGCVMGEEKGVRAALWWREGEKVKNTMWWKESGEGCGLSWRRGKGVKTSV